MILDSKTKREIIEASRNAYGEALLQRAMRGNNEAALKLASGVNNILRESCYEISSLINYIIKEHFADDIEENIVCHTIFKPEGCSGLSHYINIVNGEVIDATVDQFNSILKPTEEFTPYNIIKEHYAGIEKKEPLDPNVINLEIETCKEMLGLK